MTVEDANLAGEISNWPTKKELFDLLTVAGFEVYEGRYSLRLRDFDDFSFEHLGGPGPGYIEAGHPSTEALIEFSRHVSETLAKANVKHRFEIYSGTDELAAYLHHDWPRDW